MRRRRNRGNPRPSAPAVAAGLLCVVLGLPAQAGISDRYRLTLPAQDLSATLVRLGEITNVSIIFSDRMVAELSSAAVEGEYDIQQALTTALRHTDLEYRVISRRAIAIVGKDIAAPLAEEMPEMVEHLFYIEELLVQGRKVTGSRLRQFETNGFAPVDILSGTELRLSGAQSLSELLKYIPVVSGNSTSTAVSNGGDGTATVTLRGLPASNTLVLLNGQRIAHNGFGGDSVDINTIPSAAIERVEILKDGASAIYGSDAIAGVVNIILRKHYDGLRAEAYYGRSSRGDNDTRAANLIWGGESERGAFMLAANVFSQAGFASRDRDFSQSADSRARGGVDKRSTATPAARISLNGDTYILAGDADGRDRDDYRIAGDDELFNYPDFTSSLSPSERASLYFNSQLDLTHQLTATLSASYTQTEAQVQFAPSPVFTAFEQIPLPIAADNPFNPFGVELTDVRRRMLEIGERRQHNNNRAARLAAGLQGHTERWEWSVNGNWSRTSARETFIGLLNAANLQRGLGAAAQCRAPCVAIDLLGPAGSLSPDQIAYLRASAVSTGSTELRNLTADFSTSLWQWPAGRVGLAFGAEIRHESIRIEPDPLAAEGILIGPNFNGSSGDRDVVEGYMEWLLPLLSDRPWAKSMRLNLALRHSQFSDFGRTTNPKLSLKYQPDDQWTIRTTYAKAFRAPSLIELFKGESQTQAFLFDPCTDPDNIGRLPGCRQQTDPLRSQYLTLVGGDQNLRAETATSYSLGAIWQPSRLDPLTITVDYFHINQDNVIDANAQFFVTTNAETGKFADRVTRDDNNEITQVISTKANLGQRDLSGVDIGVSWHRDTAAFGTVAANLSASHLMKYLSQISPIAAVEDLAGTFSDSAADGSGALPAWKTHLSLYWQLQRWEAAYSLNYLSALTEIVPGSDRQRRIDDWLTHDMQMSYLLFRGATRVTVGVNNLLDAPPPFAAAAFNDNFDSRNYDGIGRYWYAKLSHDF